MTQVVAPEFFQNQSFMENHKQWYQGLAWVWSGMHQCLKVAAPLLQDKSMSEHEPYSGVGEALAKEC